MKRHERKISPTYFAAAELGVKPWELRQEDRDRFEVRDEIRLREVDDSGSYTGGEIHGVITYVLRHEGLAPGWCVFTYDRVS